MSESDSPAVDIEGLYAAIKTGLGDQFPNNSVYVDYYAAVETAVSQDAVLFELDKCFPAESTGTGQFSAELAFQAWVVVPLSGKKYADAHIHVRSLALSVAGVINGNKWDRQHISPAEITGCAPVSFYKSYGSEHLAYLVTWTHGCVVGKSVWDSYKEGVVPSAVYLGKSPDIGAAHEDDYRQIKS